jgi:DNA polymerase-3 subunit alpha
MLFEDRLKELKDDYDLNEPIAFKVRISKDENFTRMNILKIETIFDAQKEKVKTKQKEVQEPSITVAIPFSNDENMIYKLFEIVAENQGKRELKLLIKSKLADLELETGFKVTSNIEKLIPKIEGAYIVDETYTTNK